MPTTEMRSEGTGIRPFWIGSVAAGIVAPSKDRRDDVAIVGYPSSQAFRGPLGSDTCKARADPHRAAAALADWRSMATNKMDLP